MHSLLVPTQCKVSILIVIKYLDKFYTVLLFCFQMSGRAGRRGQDLLGDVYFFNIPLPKIEKLIKSNVPELRGQFPLSITLVLRLMLLASKGDDPEDAKAKVPNLTFSKVKCSLLACLGSVLLFF